MSFKLHGWPDLSIGWRYQVPMLMNMGYRVVCPDLMGYGGTDAPRVPPESIENYSYKRAARDVKQLAINLSCDKVIVGGHDWGAAIAYRVALWYPDLVSRMFTVCTPFFVPAKTFKPVEDLARTRIPYWGYQLQLASGQVEQRIRTKEQIKQFLNAVYGGRGSSGELGFDVVRGCSFDRLPTLRRTEILDEKTLDFYAEQYSKNGMHQTQCWYSSLEQNFKDELLLEKTTIDVPLLFIQATKDAALPPAMSTGMEQYCTSLTRRSVETSHWALWEAPEDVNHHIREWLGRTNGSTSRL